MVYSFTPQDVEPVYREVLNFTVNVPTGRIRYDQSVREVLRDIGKAPSGR